MVLMSPLWPYNGETAYTLKINDKYSIHKNKD